MSNLSAAAVHLNISESDLREILEDVPTLEGFTFREIVEMIYVPWEDPAD